MDDQLTQAVGALLQRAKWGPASGIVNVTAWHKALTAAAEKSRTSPFPAEADQTEQAVVRARLGSVTTVTCSARC